MLIKKYKVLDQHKDINDALQARDSDAARSAVEAHLNFVENALNDQRKALEHEAIALQRLQHETEN